MKIRKIEFGNHPVLGNLKLDFTGQNGKAIDTIILAGENGVGKSLILNEIYKLLTTRVQEKRDDGIIIFELELSIPELKKIVEAEETKRYFTAPIKDNIIRICYNLSIANWGQIKVQFNGENNSELVVNGDIIVQKEFEDIRRVIFSDVEINFNPKEIKSVTSKNVDNEEFKSEKSNANIATDITQLLIDVQSVDALEFNDWARRNVGQPVDESKIDTRMKRFSNAFEFMFPTKKYKRIDTTAQGKIVVFEEHQKEMGIKDLSSGEKQIVFRGSFLLKDKQSSKGAVVLIDEPEISLHPTWQLKVLSFFKKLFTEEGKQTSQLIVSTHSPFIIHNSNRSDDKVIILQKDEFGQIKVQEDPSFYSWSNEKKIETAFNVSHILQTDITTVFLEGETDEMYFNKAMEAFGIDDSKLAFKWIGRINERGGAENTGDKALNNARTFFIANEDMIKGKVVLLYDSDTNKPDEDFNDLSVRCMEKATNNSVFFKGVESLLSFDSSFDHTQFYSERTKTDDYGAESVIRDLNKMALCNHICGLDGEAQKEFLKSIKVEIDKLISN